MTYKNLYIRAVSDPEPVEFQGNHLDDLRAFPIEARREAGHQLDQVQSGQEPDDWKPMNTVGQGVKEIRIRDAAGSRPSYLPCQVCRCRLPASLLPEEDREDEQGRRGLGRQALP